MFLSNFEAFVVGLLELVVLIPDRNFNFILFEDQVNHIVDLPLVVVDIKLKISLNGVDNDRTFHLAVRKVIVRALGTTAEIVKLIEIEPK